MTNPILHVRTERLNRELIRFIDGESTLKDTFMLVTFSCPAYADITMFGEEAIQLLKMMGHSGTVPSAITAEDIPAALQRLETSLASARELPRPSAEEEDDETRVPLHHRAIPLIDLLKAAVKAECDVMWDSR